LQGTWIGAGLAIDWIAMRGQPIPEQEYRKRYDEAASALIALLADLPPEIAKSLAQGSAENNPADLVPIPAGVWPQTAAVDCGERDTPFWLVGVDDDVEGEGAILGHRISGYRRLQFRTDFIRESWSETTLEVAAPKIRRVVARAEIRRWIEQVIAETPVDLAPLRQNEIIAIVGMLLDKPPRDTIRELATAIRPEAKRGPRKGRRQPDRKKRIEEFGGKMLSAKLHN
jgi:hypothetical protein